MQLSSVQPHKTKIILYSHDTQGLGHTRRNLAIATALAQFDPNITILLILGTRESASFTLPPNVDCLTLPALTKDQNGGYQPRNLAISQQRLIQLRTETIRAAVKSFAPDVFMVDKVPLGAFNELEPSLAWLRRQPQTRCILGLRDILDDSQTIYREWHLAGYDEVIRTYYDAVWVYGDKTVFDPVQEYGFAKETAAKIAYTGYLNRFTLRPLSSQPDALTVTEQNLPTAPFILCMVGGGQDGDQLAKAFLQADLPTRIHGVVVTGPFMAAERRQELEYLAQNHPRQRLLTFTTEPEHLLKRADRVVAMGGYNTTCELLALKKSALIVPRVKPRQEQLIRAERLAQLGLIDCLHPDNLSAKILSQWMAEVSTKQQFKLSPVDMSGLTRLPGLLQNLLNYPSQRLPLVNVEAQPHWAFQELLPQSPPNTTIPIPLQ